MKLTLPAPSGFRFSSAVCSHGFFVLAPNTWNPASDTLTTGISLTDKRALAVRVREAGGGVVVDSPGSAVAVERTAIRAAVRRMLRLNEDLADFHARCRASASHARAPEMGFGRLIRSATLFEDIVKVICTCNVTWRQTVTMVNGLVRHWGIPITAPGPSLWKGGKAWGFPTPARLAGARESSLRRLARVGYRAVSIRRLARDVANGRIDLETIERHEGPTDDLCRLLRKIHGVGDYAAGNLCMLLGRYDRLAIDTEMLRLLKSRYPDRSWTPADMKAHYEAWRPYQFLAYWFELWEDYTARHGPPRDWQPERVGQSITAQLSR